MFVSRPLPGKVLVLMRKGKQIVSTKLRKPTKVLGEKQNLMVYSELWTSKFNLNGTELSYLKVSSSERDDLQFTQITGLVVFFFATSGAKH